MYLSPAKIDSMLLSQEFQVYQKTGANCVEKFTRKAILVDPKYFN